MPLFSEEDARRRDEEQVRMWREKRAREEREPPRELRPGSVCGALDEEIEARRWRLSKQRQLAESAERERRLSK